MKNKQFLFLLLIFITKSACAQVWPLASSVWHYDKKSFDLGNTKFDKYDWSDNMYYVHDVDTLLGVPMQDVYQNGIHLTHFGRTGSVLYYYDVLHSEIDTIIDYNAGIGSTWHLTNTMGVDETITMMSMTTILVNGISRRQFVLNFSILGDQIFIEDVGFDSFILPNINTCYYTGSSTDCYVFLTKYTDSAVSDYVRKATFPYSCSYHLKQDYTYFDVNYIQCNDSNYVIDLSNTNYVYWFDGSIDKTRFFNHTQDIACLIEYDGCLGPSDTMHIVPKKHILEPVITNIEDFHCDATTPVTLHTNYTQYPTTAVQYFWFRDLLYNLGANIDSITVNTIGTYNVMITDAYNCTVFSDPYFYKVKPIVLQDVIVSTNCVANQFQLNPQLPAGVVVDSFYWNFPGIDGIFNPYVGTVYGYQITIVDTGSCIYLGQNTLGTGDIFYEFHYPELSFSSDPSALCNGSSIGLHTNVPNANWFLNGTNIAVNQDSITADAVGDYWCSYVDSLGCNNVSQDTIHISSINLTPTMYVDTLTNGQIILVAQPTSPDFYYQWYMDGNPIAVAALNDTLYPTTSGVYECWVTDLLCGDYTNSNSVIISDIDEWTEGIMIEITDPYIKVKGAMDHAINISLVQLDGKVVYEKAWHENEIEIPVSHLAQGLYLLVFQDMDTKKIASRKIVLNR